MVMVSQAHSLHITALLAGTVAISGIVAAVVLSVSS